MRRAERLADDVAAAQEELAFLFGELFLVICGLVIEVLWDAAQG